MASGPGCNSKRLDAWTSDPVSEKRGLRQVRPVRTDYRISGDYEFMVRILYRKEVTLSYLPEILIYMSHGGTSTNSLGAYVESMMEGHRALVENHVPFAWVTDLCRVVRGAVTVCHPVRSVVQ